MTMSAVRIASQASVPVAVIRRQVGRAELGHTVRDGCGRAFTFARERGLSAGRNVALYWDGTIMVEAGVELAAPFEEGDGVVRSATPGGLTASVTHLGPYGQLGAAHAAIRDWCATHGYRVVGPNWEVYGHWQSAWDHDASGIRTDVFHLVVPRAIPSVA